MFEIATILEKQGYKRIWLGEHRAYDCAWRSPEILIPLLLASTDKIKIESVGNLLRLHKFFKVVQGYSLMERLFPNKVIWDFRREILL